MSTDPTPEYARLDALSDRHYATLTRLASGWLPSDWWFFGGPLDRLWLFAVLVGERPACDITIARRADDVARPCPVEAVLDETALSYVVGQRCLRPSATYCANACVEVRHLYITPDTDAAATMRAEWQADQLRPAVVGDALGYPEAAVEAFTASDDPFGQSVERYVREELTIDAADARYLWFLPYVPAPDPEHIRAGIREGKRYAALPERIEQDRPAFEGLAENCPDPDVIEERTGYT